MSQFCSIFLQMMKVMCETEQEYFLQQLVHQKLQGLQHAASQVQVNGTDWAGHRTETPEGGAAHLSHRWISLRNLPRGCVCACVCVCVCVCVCSVSLEKEGATDGIEWTSISVSARAATSSCLGFLSFPPHWLVLPSFPVILLLLHLCPFFSLPCFPMSPVPFFCSSPSSLLSLCPFPCFCHLQNF